LAEQPESRRACDNVRATAESGLPIDTHVCSRIVLAADQGFFLSRKYWSRG